MKKSLNFFLQDERAKAEASRAITDNAEKIKKQKNNLEELEASLTKEEKVLEEIRDSLKGSRPQIPCSNHSADDVYTFRKDASLP